MWLPAPYPWPSSSLKSPLNSAQRPQSVLAARRRIDPRDDVIPDDEPPWTERRRRSGRGDVRDPLSAAVRYEGAVAFEDVDDRRAFRRPPASERFALDGGAVGVPAPSAEVAEDRLVAAWLHVDVDDERAVGDGRLRRLGRSPADRRSMAPRST